MTNPATSRPLQLPILERGSELRALRAAIDGACAGRGRLVVIAGEAGIGKSTLLREASAYARDRGVQTLSAAGSELERQYAGGVAISLFERLVHGRDDRADVLFNGPARSVAHLFERREHAEDAGSGDPFATVHGLYWLALNAAEQAPLFIAVDDAQWADDGSLRFLHYLGRRIEDVPIALALAFRSGEGAGLEELGRLFLADRSAIQLEPAALSEEAVGKLLDVIGLDASLGALRREFRTATGGNPFLVTELLWHLRRERLSNHDGLPSEMTALVPERVRRFVDTRFSRLDPGTRRFAEMVAILGGEATIARAATLAGMAEGEAADQSRRLSAASVLASKSANRFTHPLVRDAVYASIPAAVRNRAHRDAARLLAAEGAPVGIVAGHLLAAAPAGDASAVGVLLDAAQEATARGEPAVAVRYLRRALQERPSGAQLLAVRVQLARAEAASGSPDAVDSYREALALERDPRERAALLLALGHALVAATNHAAAADAFSEGLQVLGGRDDVLEGRLEGGLLASAWLGMTHRDEAERITARVIEDRTLGPARRELAMSIAFQRSISGSATAPEMVALVKRALAAAPIETLVTEGQMVELATGVLFSTDELPLELDLLDQAIAATERAGVYSKVGLYSVARCWPDYFMGRLGDVIADTDAGFRAAEVGWEAFYPAAHGVQAMAHLERADLDAARHALVIDPDPWSQRADWLIVLIARGRLALALGDAARAVEELRAAGEFAERVGFRNPGPPAWRQWLAVALAVAGHRDEARSLAAEAVEIARAWGAHWPLGAALRAAALAEGGPGGLELLREAVRLLEDSPAELELARAVGDLGAALRRHGHLRDARQVLTRAVDLSHRLGAQALLNGAAAELRAAGARPRRFARSGVAALTPSESRVAQLARQGRTNREIAQALFVTPKAVEFHLANVYQKLEITSRAELVGVLPGQ